MADYSPWLEDMIKLFANISDVTAQNSNVKLDTILENQNNINDTLLEIAEINKILSEILFKLNNTLSNIDYNLETKKKNTTSTLNISDKTVDNNTEDN